MSLADLAREAIAAYLPERDAERPLSIVGLGDRVVVEDVDREVGRFIGKAHDAETGPWTTCRSASSTRRS